MVHVGAAGAGQVVKVCNQVVVAVVIEAVSEALVLGAKAGVDPGLIADVLQGGLASTKVLEMRRENMLSGQFDPGFRIRLHLKDLKNALELARETNVAVPAAAQVEQLMRAMVRRSGQTTITQVSSRSSRTLPPSVCPRRDCPQARGA